MDLTTFDQGEQVGQESLMIDTASLYQAFEQVKDGRKRKGKRYPLAFILTLIMLRKMAGETTIEGIIFARSGLQPTATLWHERQAEWPERSGHAQHTRCWHDGTRRAQDQHTSA